MRLRNSWQSCSQNGRAHRRTMGIRAGWAILCPTNPSHALLLPKPPPIPSAPMELESLCHTPAAFCLCTHSWQQGWAPVLMVILSVKSSELCQIKLTLPWFPFGFHSVSLVHFTLSEYHYLEGICAPVQWSDWGKPSGCSNFSLQAALLRMAPRCLGMCSAVGDPAPFSRWLLSGHLWHMDGCWADRGGHGVGKPLRCKDNFINWDPVGSFCLKKLFFPPYLHSLSGHLLLKTQQNTALTFTSIALKTKWDEYYGKTGSLSLLTPLGFRSDSQKMSVWLSCCALSIALQSVIMSAFLTALSGDHFSSNLVSNNKDKISYKYFCGFLFAEL